MTCFYNEHEILLPYKHHLRHLDRNHTCFGKVYEGLEVIDAIRAVDQQMSPDAIEEKVKQAVSDALMKAGHELKARELDMKERKTEAEIGAIVAQAVQTGVASAFSAMQGGAQIAQMPQIAPIADAIMQGAGYIKPVRSDDPNFPSPQGVAAPVMTAQDNTSPEFPPVPQQADSSMQGIETARTTDNLAGEMGGPVG